MSTFGERLKQLRKSADITQSELAEKLGVVPSAIGKYERIPSSYPSIDALIKLADYFDVSIDYLLRGKEHIGSVENNISGMMNSSLIQANQNGVVIHSEQSVTPEAAELLHIYESLDGRNRLKLLNYAVQVSEGEPK